MTELMTEGWKNVDRRLGRIEKVVSRLEEAQSSAPAAGRAAPSSASRTGSGSRSASPRRTSARRTPSPKLGWLRADRRRTRRASRRDLREVRLSERARARRGCAPARDVGVLGRRGGIDTRKPARARLRTAHPCTLLACATAWLCNRRLRRERLGLGAEPGERPAVLSLRRPSSGSVHVGPARRPRAARTSRSEVVRHGTEQAAERRAPAGALVGQTHRQVDRVRRDGRPHLAQGAPSRRGLHRRDAAPRLSVRARRLPPVRVGLRVRRGAQRAESVWISTNLGNDPAGSSTGGSTPASTRSRSRAMGRRSTSVHGTVTRTSTCTRFPSPARSRRRSFGAADRTSVSRRSTPAEQVISRSPQAGRARANARSSTRSRTPRVGTHSPATAVRVRSGGSTTRTSWSGAGSAGAHRSLLGLGVDGQVAADRQKRCGCFGTAGRAVPPPPLPAARAAASRDERRGRPVGRRATDLALRSRRPLVGRVQRGRPGDRVLPEVRRARPAGAGRRVRHRPPARPVPAGGARRRRLRRLGGHDRNLPRKGGAKGSRRPSSCNRCTSSIRPASTGRSSSAAALVSEARANATNRRFDASANTSNPEARSSSTSKCRTRAATRGGTGGRRNARDCRGRGPPARPNAGAAPTERSTRCSHGSSTSIRSSSD